MSVLFYMVFIKKIGSKKNSEYNRTDVKVRVSDANFKFEIASMEENCLFFSSSAEFCWRDFKQSGGW